MDTGFQGVTQSKNGYYSPVNAIQKDSSGRRLFAGDFNVFNGTPRNSLVRLKTDGSVDATFAPPGTDPIYYALALQTDGKILAGGNFTNIGGLDRKSLVRLTQNGDVDPTFVPQETDGNVNAIAVQADGKILVGGDFGGHYLVRLNSDGSFDSSFAPPDFINYTVYGITLQSGGKILVNGLFSDWQDPTSPRYLARLNSDGSNDTTFTPILDGAVKSVAIQADGKLLIGGTFREPDGFHHHLMARLLPDGRLDQTFESGIQMLNGCGDEEAVYTVALDTQNRVMVGGSFFEVNGLPRNGLVRLYNDGAHCAGLFGFETDTLIVTEANTNLTINIVRTGDNLGRVSVHVAVEPYYKAGPADFSFIDTELVFESGVSTRSVTVRIVDDHIIETGEALALRLSNPQGGAGLRNPSLITVVSADDESANFPGAVDRSFNPQIAGGSITHMALQPDGKILITGQFTEISGQPRHDIARLLADGSLDPTFNYTGAYRAADRIALWGDKIFLNALASNTDAVIRLNSDGSIDPTFVSPAFTIRPGGYIGVTALAAQTDGKLIVSGGFSLVNGAPHDGIVRLNLDGSVDTTFNGSFFGGIYDAGYALLILNDGSMLVAGTINSIDGPTVLHFSPTGVQLPDFKLPPGMNRNSAAHKFAVTPEGKILLGGSFYLNDGSLVPVFRFNVDGSLDTTLQLTSSGSHWPYPLAVQPDGKLLIDSVSRHNANGSLDPTFFGSDTTYDVHDIIVQPNGDILIAGSFASVNQIPAPGLARLRGGNYTGSGAFEIVSGIAISESAGVAKIGVRRTLSASGLASVRFKTQNGTARAGEDFGAIDQVLNFADGDTTIHEIEIPIIDDAIYQGDLNFTVLLESIDLPLGPGPSEAIVTILDDESAFRFTNTEGQGIEGSFLAVTVERVGPTKTAAQVDLAFEAGSATSGIDFTPLSATLHFDANINAQVIFVPLNDDQIPEPDETFFVKLSNPTPGFLVPAAPMKATIVDNAGRVGFDAEIVRATQADRVARVSLRQQRPYPVSPGDAPIHLHYEIASSTQPADSQFIPVAGDLEIPAIDTTIHEISIPLLPNNIVAAPNEISVRLSLLSGEAVLDRGTTTVLLYHPAEVKPAGSFDASFTANIPSHDVTIISLAATADYVYTGGYLRTPDGTDARLLRYRRDGSFDSGFQMKLSDYPRVIVPLANGKILIGGSFDIVNDRPSAGLVRLNSDGTTDLSFDAQLAPHALIYDLKLAPDGKLIVAAFVSLPGLNQAYLTRLLPDGAVDPTFTPASSNDPINYARFETIALQADGKIVVGGSFSSIDGVLRTNLARFNADGSADNSFQISGGTIDHAQQIAIAGSEILVRGAIHSDALGYINLARLDTTGAFDSSFTFTNTMDWAVEDMEVDSSGNAYIAGPFTGINDRTFRYIARLKSGGAPDDLFFAPQNIDGVVTLILPSDSGIYIAGMFSEIDGVPAPMLARLWPSALRPYLGSPLIAGNHAAVRFSVTPGANYILESTSDFKTWTQVTTGVSASGNETIDLPIGNENAVFYRLH